MSNTNKNMNLCVNHIASRIGLPKNKKEEKKPVLLPGTKNRVNQECSTTLFTITCSLYSLNISLMQEPVKIMSVSETSQSKRLQASDCQNA